MERELHIQESVRLKSLDPAVDHVARAETDPDLDPEIVLLRLLLHSDGTIRDQLIDADPNRIHVADLRQFQEEQK
jgi:hypothetical protein